MQNIDWNNYKPKEYNICDLNFLKQDIFNTPTKEEKIIDIMKKDIALIKEGYFNFYSKSKQKKLKAIAYTIPLNAWFKK
ncbi:MAG: hypothetical protein IH934_04800 [Nanoarchaeota archaeon]|nr:hypothetical protein [Nanoarchaeota archaeon]